MARQRLPVMYRPLSVTEPIRFGYCWGTDGNTQYLGGLWIDGKETLRKKQLISDYPSEAGWKVIAAEPDTSWAVGDYCKIDNIKSWHSTASQIKELVEARK